SRCAVVRALLVRAGVGGRVVGTAARGGGRGEGLRGGSTGLRACPGGRCRERIDGNGPRDGLEELGEMRSPRGGGPVQEERNHDRDQPGNQQGPAHAPSLLDNAGIGTFTTLPAKTPFLSVWPKLRAG